MDNGGHVPKKYSIFPIISQIFLQPGAIRSSIYIRALILDDLTLLHLYLLKSLPSCFSNKRKPDRSTSARLPDPPKW